jgi:hypothetical protein
VSPEQIAALRAAAEALAAGMPRPGQIEYRNYYLRRELDALRAALRATE